MKEWHECYKSTCKAHARLAEASGSSRQSRRKGQARWQGTKRTHGAGPPQPGKGTRAPHGGSPLAPHSSSCSKAVTAVPAAIPRRSKKRQQQRPRPLHAAAGDMAGSLAEWQEPRAAAQLQGCLLSPAAGATGRSLARLQELGEAELEALDLRAQRKHRCDGRAHLTVRHR